ncbi:rRNA maturation RNase YbeY [bacterium CG10_46_32]|nr:MAG: rRNA maturation RNase YbeY [bacterium CG10_46_32]PIR56447.1 MAG: rRNA maturation RNase YbeY [Parcubacteria group bacterium CG10_big_fil_rev_8_21_14_0_10_46_32]
MRLVFINQVPHTGRIPRLVILYFLNRAKIFFSQAKKGHGISVVFVSPATSKKLNTRYRKKPRPTNVLSFVSENQGELGDIIICPAIAQKEANISGVGFQEYVAYLFVHGLLHLLGFDHQSKKEEQIMDAAAEKILSTK